MLWRGLLLSTCLLLAGCGGTAPEPITPGKPIPKARYFALPGSKDFHRLNCPAAEKIMRHPIYYYCTPEEAIRDGYRPCPVCKPTESE
jgi:hypothetical protein